jgi:FkbM family methyltransferase
LNWTYVRDVGLVRFAVRTAIRQVFKRLLGRGIDYRLPTGLRIHLPAASRYGSEVFVTGAHVDCGSEALFVRLLDRDGDFVDAGANIGYYALYAAPCVRRVFAFEPNPATLPDLRANAARADNVEVVPMALFSRPGRMPLDPGTESEVSRLAPSGGGPATVEVEVTTVDAFFASRPDARLSGLKIDVEGADLAVLEGAKATVARDRPLVLTEFGASDGNRPDALAAFAQSLGYAMHAFVRTDAGSGRFSLRAVDAGDVAAGRAKMVFLVPERLAAAFSDASGKGGR